MRRSFVVLFILTAFFAAMSFTYTASAQRVVPIGPGQAAISPPSPRRNPGPGTGLAPYSVQEYVYKLNLGAASAEVAIGFRAPARPGAIIVVSGQMIFATDQGDQWLIYAQSGGRNTVVSQFSFSITGQTTWKISCLPDQPTTGTLTITVPAGVSAQINVNGYGPLTPVGTVK